MRTFIKLRPRPPAGSLPDVLQSFQSELRFYQEIASEVGVRVPRCIVAEESESGFRLEMEDLSGWSPGANPLEVAAALGDLHQRWQGEAAERWPWLRRPGVGADLIAALYERTWDDLRTRDDLTPEIRLLGDRLVGNLFEAELAEGQGGEITLIHGDASLHNYRTGARGEIAFLDWEDVRLASGVVDLAWLLVSSVDPDLWEMVIDQYGGDTSGLPVVLPASIAQGLLSFNTVEKGSSDEAAWIRRLDAAVRRASKR